MRDIQPLVAPRSIAVIGASTNAQKSGGILFSNLVSGGFRGPLYPINPNASEVLGVKAYPSLAEIPEPVDLVYIVLPSQFMEDAIRQCVSAKARAACIITAGFAESGEDGKVLQQRILKIGREGGLLMAGPNTIGMVNTDVAMMGSFVNFPNWTEGGISLFTQTGIFTGAVMRQIMDCDVQRPPISKSIDVGNKIDVDEVDFLEFAARDEGTKVVGLYIESVRDLPEFRRLVMEVGASKPVVLLKPGRTPFGKAASAFHTGSPPSEDAELVEALRGTGVIRVDDEDEFINVLKALAYLPRPRGRRVGIATTSGALGVMASDYVWDFGLQLANYREDTLARMETIFPAWLKAANPFDFWIGIDVKGSQGAHEIGLHAVFADPDVDVVLCTLLAPPNADFPTMGSLLRELRETYDKPVALVLYGSAGARWTREIEGAGIPVYPTVRAGVRALALISGVEG